MLKRTLFYCLFALSGLAHAGAEQEVLFEPKAVFPAQGGPGAKFLLLPQGSILLVGGTGSLMLGQNVGLGAGGYSLADPFAFLEDGQLRDLGLSFGGLILDYSLLPKKLFYLNFSVMGGFGQAHVIPRVTGGQRQNANFAFIDPVFNLMLNVTRELRLSIGAGYFLISGADTQASLGTGVSGPNIQAVLNYGKL